MQSRAESFLSEEALSVQSDRRVKHIFLDALELPPERRGGFLDQQCAEAPELRRQVEQMLAARGELRGFMEVPLELATCAPAAPVRRATPPQISQDRTGERRHDDPHVNVADGVDPLIGCRIGRYTILRIVGSGGMGSVYEAQQEQPRRGVALKIIRPGLTTHQMLHRFERETQALGQLHHPGIARIYEAGMADIHPPDGMSRQRVDLDAGAGERQSTPPAAFQSMESRRVPFFAMELIRGRPIDLYVREAGLAVKQRFGLFAHVCDAVHYAHQHGVIHRDLKPANILVDEFGQPKVLDFGVARLTDADVQATLQTEVGQLVGTLAYMSPEQVAARPDELDVRSDVYGLGVVLYELIAGKPPYHVAGHTIPEAVRIIREEEPSRLSSIDSRFRGDVETIVAKALEKDKARRYASAAELAADVRRYLNDEPIVARPPSTFYQLRKFARRHRALVAGTVGTLLALTVGVVVATSYALAELRQRRLAEAKTAEAERLAYVASIAAATAAVEQGDLELAQQNLARATAALRGWEWQHLAWASNRSIATLATEVGMDPHTLVSADLSTLATVTPDGSIAVWDLMPAETAPYSTTLRARFHVPFELDPYGARLSPDGSRLLLNESRGGISMWDIRADTGAPPSTPIWRRAAALARGDISPDGTRVAHSDQNGGVTLYDARSGELVRTIRLQGMGQGSPFYIVFHPDGRRLRADGQLIDLATGTRVGDAKRDYGAYLTRDWSRVVVLNPGIQLYSTATGETLATFTVADPRWVLENAWWSPDGHAVYIRRGNGFVEVMDAALSRIATFSLPRRFKGAPPDGRHSFVMTADGSLELWDMLAAGSFALPTAPKAPSRAAAVSPDARQIAIGGWGYVRLLDAVSGELLWNTAVGPKIHASVAVSPNGQRVAAGYAANGLGLLDAADGRIVAVADAGFVPRALLFLPLGENSPVANGATPLLVGDSRGAVSLYDAEALAAEARVVGRHDSPVNALAASPNGRLVASGSGDAVDITEVGSHSTGAADNTIRLWRTDTWECVRVIRCESTVMALAFSPGGRRLAAALADGSVVIYLPHSAEAPIIWRQAGPTRALAFHPSGTRLVACGQRAIRVWDCLNDEEVAVLPSEESHFFAAGFTADSRTLVASGFHTAVLSFESGPAEVDPLTRFSLVWAQARLAREGRNMNADIEQAVARDEHLPAAVREAALRTTRISGDHVRYLVSDGILEIRQRHKDPAKLENAIRRLARARELLPNDASPAALHALALYYAGRHEEALAAAEAALSIRAAAHHPPSAAAVLVQALCHHAAGRSDIAVELFAKSRGVTDDRERPDLETRELFEHAAELGFE